MTDVLLSICIPTYNRAPYLEKCLQNIVKQVGNNPQVEVIIADNVSDDNTQAVSEAYTANYQNVKYFRNETNIGGDKNFIRVLKLGTGKYLKLINDYVEFKDGCVLKMLEIVKDHLETKEILYFANGVSYLRKKDFYYSEDLDEFLRVCSFHSQWIGTIGFWNEDFNTMMKYYHFKTKSFFQTELLFENFNLGKKAVTYTRGIFISHQVQNKKTGFNFFDIFINSYFNTIIKGLKKEKKISKSTYRKEKNKFFVEWVFNWYKKVKIKKNHSIEIDDKGAESIIFNTFKYSPIFYLYLFYLPFYMIGFYFKKLIRYFKHN
jgi:abequosyltransferase